MNEWAHECPPYVSGLWSSPDLLDGDKGSQKTVSGAKVLGVGRKKYVNNVALKGPPHTYIYISRHECTNKCTHERKSQALRKKVVVG